MSQKSREAAELAYVVGCAKQLFGAHGDAWHPSYAVKGSENYCVVGIRLPAKREHQWEIKGIGQTFADALKDAEARA